MNTHHYFNAPRLSPFDLIIGLIIGLFLCLAFSGCAGGLLQTALNKNENLTVEQIEAYQKTGHKVFLCFSIGGPPPVGNTTFLVVPQDVNPGFNFGSNCTLISGVVDLPKVQ